jgi:hypothetical protein
MSTLRPDGVEFGNGSGYSSTENLQTSGWFHYRWTESGGTSFGSTVVVGQTTGVMNLPPRSKIFVYTNTPLRGDTTAWGGHYEDLQYSVNGGSWTSVGRSGFVSRMMTSNQPITAHKDFCVMDFNSITSDFTLTLRTTHQQYNGGGAVNSSCGISGGDDNTTYDANNQQNSVWKQMIIMGYGQGSSS